ncbi:MAG: ferritin-like domain-containing protein, partial [Gaiellaceae bacterium]
EETEGQIRNLEQALEAIGANVGAHDADSANGIAAEGEKLTGKVDDELIDAVLLGAAAKTEHVEIAMYEGLITKAEAMGEDDIVSLLQENLEQEHHTLEEVRAASQKLSQERATQTACAPWPGRGTLLPARPALIINPGTARAIDSRRSNARMHSRPTGPFDLPGGNDACRRRSSTSESWRM